LQDLVGFGNIVGVRIEYSEHLKFRLEIRKIPKSLPEKILYTADDYFYDTVTKLRIAVKEITNKKRPTKTFMIAFTKSDEIVRLITIHPLKYRQKLNRINSKRWLKIKMTI
jgi:hypothetical protein